MKKQSNVYLLPTDKASNLLLCSNGKLAYPEDQNAYNFVRAHGNPKDYHLYITSNEEIKEGDWIVARGIIEKCKLIDSEAVTTKSGKVISLAFCKKIIASTDPSLKELVAVEFGTNYEEYKSIPSIPESFIKHYISEYNKGNIIIVVNIEYEEAKYTSDDYKKYGERFGNKIYIPKVDSNNYISILPTKDSWTREEVINLVLKAASYGFGGTKRLDNIDEWINENL